MFRSLKGIWAIMILLVFSIVVSAQDTAGTARIRFINVTGETLTYSLITQESRPLDIDETTEYETIAAGTTAQINVIEGTNFSGAFPNIVADHDYTVIVLPGRFTMQLLVVDETAAFSNPLKPDTLGTIQIFNNTEFDDYALDTSDNAGIYVLAESENSSAGVTLKDTFTPSASLDLLLGTYTITALSPFTGEAIGEPVTVELVAGQKTVVIAFGLLDTEVQVTTRALILP